MLIRRFIGGGFLSSLIFASVAGAAQAADYIITFSGEIERAILPAGEDLIPDTLVGGEIDGRIVLTEEGMQRDTNPAAGEGRTFFIKSNKNLAISGAIEATFEGGNLFVQDGQISFDTARQYCTVCNATGEFIETRRAADGRVNKYEPTRYLIIHSAPYSGNNAILSEITTNIINFSKDNPVKAMLMFSMPETTNDDLKFVFSIKNIQLIGR